MKRFLTSIFVLCVLALGLYAQNNEFDPANPGDPQPFYVLQVQVSPTSGGTTNITRTMLAEGQEVVLRISPNTNFQFQQWVCGEEALSSDTYLYYTMPARNVTITAQMLYVEQGQEEFDPTSPSDPTGSGEEPKRHLVSIYCSPSVGGYTNQSVFYMQEEEQRNLYAYNNAGYEFVGWYVGDHLESHNNPVSLTMHQSDVSLIARFRFAPTSPEDPGVNLYDASTGNLVIDHFTPGRLSDAVYSLLGSENYNNVRSLVAIGEMTSSDYGVVNYFSNLEILDLSHTTGYTAVPSWAFEGMNQLQRILLPASVETIGYNAFYGCSTLKELVLYAPVPPTAPQDANTMFNSIPSGMIVQVPSASLALYQSSDLWNSFIILPMDTKALNISLSKDDVALYENMFLELLDTKSGQLRRYVITKHTQYAFNSVFDGTTYQLTLRNAQNKVFGQEMVTFAGNDTTVTFASLLHPVNVSVQVVDTAGDDVTDHVSVRWYDSEDTYITEGKKLSKQLENDVLRYHIQLDGTLVTTYSEPQDSSYIVNPENHNIICALRPIPSAILSGIVRDSATLSPVAYATVSVKQTIKEKYNKLFATETDANGHFSLKVMDVDYTTITVNASDYVKKTTAVEQLSNEQHINLQAFRGTNLFLQLQYRESIEDTTQWVDKDTYGFSDLQFTIRNITQNKWINNFTYSYPHIQIQDEVNPLDVLEITVESAKGILAPCITSVVVNDLYNAKAMLHIVELGSISSSYTYAPSDIVRAMLYDNEGNIVQRGLYKNQSIRFDHLPAGQYTLISFVDNDLLHSIARLSDYAKLNLQATDYVQSTITINNGHIGSNIIDTVPAYKELANYLKDGSSFSANKTSLVAGDYLTLRSQIDFLPQYKNSISNVELVAVLPQTVQLVENAILVGSTLGSYSVNQQEITIPLENYTDLVRFCVIPTSEGSFQVSAYIRFTSDGIVHTQPLGMSSFTVENAKIAAYIKYSNNQIIASGMTTPNSDIELYDNDELIGAIKAKPSGLWQIEANIPFAYNLSVHKVYARIATPLGMNMMTQTKKLFYNISSNPELQSIKMLVFEQGALHAAVTWDYENAIVTPNNYQYTAAQASFEFYADFTNNFNPNIKAVNLILYMHEGKHTLALSLDSISGKWKGTIATGMLGETGNGVINVGAEIYYDSGDNYLIDDYLIDADWLHDIISVLRGINNIQGSVAEPPLYKQFEEALNNDDDDTVLSILNTWYGDSATESSEEMSDTEIQQLTLALEQILADTVRIQEAIDATKDFRLFPKMIISDCSAIDSMVLLQNGYEAMLKTDGGKVYFYGGEDKISFVDFGENFYIEFSTPENSPLAIAMRKVQTAAMGRGDCAAADLFAPIDEGLQKIKDLTEQVTNVWSSFVDFFESLDGLYNERAQRLGESLARRMGTLPPVQRKAFLAANRAALQTINGYQKMSNMVSNFTKNLGLQNENILKRAPWMRKILSKANALLLGVDIYENLSQEAEYVHQINDISNSIPDYCPLHQSEVDALANEVCGYTKTIAYHTIEGISWNVVQLGTVITELSAAPLTGGLSVLLTAVNVFSGILGEVRSYINARADENKIARYQTLLWNVRRLKCKEDPDPEPDPIEPADPNYIEIEPIFPDLQAHIDPSGFVYEAVENNRVEGVKAVVYYKDTHENIFGEMVEEDVMWNAWDYDQENPQYTDAEGKYQWFVPQGLWQVRFEKEGYEPTQSEWLPVPPPQLEVNIPIVQLRQPQIIEVHAYADGVEMTFDKYMMPFYMTNENINVMQNGNYVSGTIRLMDEAIAYRDENVKYASRVRFVPDTKFTSNKVTLVVASRVQSYAGIAMAETFQQTFDLEQELKELLVDSVVNVTYGQTKTMLVTAIPTAAATGKILRVNLSRSELISTDAPSYILDSNGQARVVLRGEQPGVTGIHFTIDGTHLSAQAIVNVVRSNSSMTYYNITATAENGIVIGMGEYLAGEKVTLTVIPNDGYTFTSWSDGNTDNPRTITVTSDAQYEAVCEALMTDIKPSERNTLILKQVTNGQLIIIRDGVRYNVLGTRL